MVMKVESLNMKWNVAQIFKLQFYFYIPRKSTLSAKIFIAVQKYIDGNV